MPFFWAQGFALKTLKKGHSLLYRYFSQIIVIWKAVKKGPYQKIHVVKKLCIFYLIGCSISKHNKSGIKLPFYCYNTSLIISNCLLKFSILLNRPAFVQMHKCVWYPMCLISETSDFKKVNLHTSWSQFWDEFIILNVIRTWIHYLLNF